MTLLDLVSPWAAAVETDDPSARLAFHQQHAALLEQLRRTHSPDVSRLPLVESLPALHAARAELTRPEFRRLLSDTSESAARFGADIAAGIIVVPCSALDSMITVIPAPQPLLLMAIDALAPGHALGVSLARALTRLTRWTAADSDSPMIRGGGSWDRWEAMRQYPLREWVYSEGVAWHTAEALFPTIPMHRLFGLGAGEWQRLREQEQPARAQLTAVLDGTGIGPVIQWLVAPNGPTHRGADGAAILPQMGQYLAWRMTAPRVARLGLAAAIRASS